MKYNKPLVLGTIFAVASMVITTAADARHHYRYAKDRHGNCLRFDKTTGTVAGAVTGGILGSLIGGHGNHTAGTLIGAAGGGLAGHELARNGRKNC